MSLVTYAIQMKDKYYSKKQRKHAERVGACILENPVIKWNQRDFCYALALMHDLLEDTSYGTVECEMFDDERFDACLELLTKKKDEEYITYIKRIKDQARQYPEAWFVKLADIQDHLAQTETLTERLKEKYLEALVYLL